MRRRRRCSRMMLHAFIDMCPPLYLAVHQGRTEEVMALLLQQHGAAIDCQATGIIQHGQCDILEVSAERNTVLHVAAEKGHDVLIRELYAKFTEKVKGLLSRQNSARDTPLHCAARAGRVGAVDELVRLARDCGESILECKNEAGDTALHLAARHGHGTVLDSLVLAAAEPAAELNNAGVSPLYLAVMSGSVQAVRAITTCRDASSIGPSSQNALHAAVFKSSEMVRLLLEWRPTLADQVDCSGSSPLHFASSDGHSSIVGAILHAAQLRTVYAKDSGGLSALHVAARMGHDRVVKKLLESCPDAAEVRDDHGGTFLHAAAKENRSKVVSLAIENPMLRGLLDVQDRDGNTPLHLAVAPGASTAVVDALLRKGKVRADVLNNDGKTPLDLAKESTSLVTMVSLEVTLVAFGAQPRPQRQDNLNPWHGVDIVRGIEKTSDSLALVAMLIATAALAAGFNLPGGYGDNGMPNLEDRAAFKSFLFLDTFAMATSVIAVILLIYGKASRSAGSWKSFVASLHCIWVSLISLILAFYAALSAVSTTRAAHRSGLVIIFLCIEVLTISITMWIGPATKTRTMWRFLRQRSRSNGSHVIKRQFPLAGAFVPNFFLFMVITFIAFSAFGFISGLHSSKSGPHMATSPVSSPVSHL